MSINERDRNVDLKEGKILQFDLHKGGKEPPEKNWLAEMEEEDTFLARPIFDANGRKWMAPEIMQYTVLDKSEKATQLIVHLSKEELISWFDTARFSSQYELLEKLPKDK
jgi:hypothetical protein